jgi:allantoinase
MTDGGHGIDLRVTGGWIVSEDGPVRRDLYVDGGKVIAQSSEPLAIRSRSTISLTGEWVWPGFVDAHVHFYDPGFPEREDFRSGTAAAVAGGITTVVEMPNTDPVVADVPSVRTKLESIAGKAYVDYALWGALMPDGASRLNEMRDAGVRLFKGFMSAYRTRGLPRVSDWDLWKALTISRDSDIVIAVHAENHELVEGASHAAGSLPPDRYGEDHPLLAEREAVRRAALLAEESGGRLHIVHASSGEVVTEVVASRRRGARVTVETCPHYLAFTEEDGRRRGPWLRCAPPLRNASEQAALWDRLADGSIDLVASDHSPAPSSSKSAGDTDLMLAPNGMPGTQTMVPVMMALGLGQGRLSPGDIYRLCSKHPAQLAGLYPQKGSLAPGSDADFTVMDMDSAWTLTEDLLRSKNRWSPWIGDTFQSAVCRVYLRGHEVYASGELLADPVGRFLPASDN